MGVPFGVGPAAQAMAAAGWSPQQVQMQMAAWQNFASMMPQAPASVAFTAVPSGGMAPGYAMPVVGSLPGVPAASRADQAAPQAGSAKGEQLPAGASEEETFRLSIQEAKRFVAHVSRSRNVIEVVIPRQLRILEDLTAGRNAKAGRTARGV